MHTARFSPAAIFIAFVFIAQAASTAQADSLICRQDYISGFHGEHRTAHKFVGAETHELREMQVYLTCRGNLLYADSNFITPGFQRVSKLISDAPNQSLHQVIYNLV